MRKFFGRNIDDSGTEILIKLGSRYPDINDPRHYTSWRDGQVIDISPIGFNSGNRAGYSSLLLRFPNIRYQGRTENNFKLSTPVINDFRKYTRAVDILGKYQWEYNEAPDLKTVRKRDYFIDTLELLEKNHVTPGEYETIYDFSKKSAPVIIPDGTFTHLLKHEDNFLRTSVETDSKKASIAQDGAGSGTGGGFTIGAAGDYATWTAFEADLAAQLTGDLHGLGLSEETAITGFITYDVDCNGNTLYLMAESGAAHNGGAYGNGARVAFGTSDCFAYLDDSASGVNLTDVIIQSMALDSSGGFNTGIMIDESGSGGLITVNRCLIKGDTDTISGVDLNNNFINVRLTNNIIYGIGDGGSDSGIRFRKHSAGKTVYCCNNTCIKNYCNFLQDDTNSFGTYTVKNNIAQGNTGRADYGDDGGGFGTTAVNISEDATSPDASYQSKDLHTNTIFENYASDDYRLDSGGDATNLAIVDDGEDLSGTFTDDVVGTTRSTWYAGAFEISGGGGGLDIPIAMYHYMNH